MGISSEKFIVLAFAALGGYAVYRMTRATNAPQPQPPGDENVPILAPQLVGVDVPPNLDLAAAGGTLRLSQNRYYRARFETTEDPSSIAARVGVLGLSGNVYTDAAAARAAGFPEWAVQNPTPDTRWFAGSSASTSVQPRPPGLALMWTARPA